MYIYQFIPINFFSQFHVYYRTIYNPQVVKSRPPLYNYTQRTQYTRPPHKIAPLRNAPPPPKIRHDESITHYTPYVHRRRVGNQPLYVPTPHGLQIIDEVSPPPPRHRPPPPPPPHLRPLSPPPPTPPHHEIRYMPQTPPEASRVYYMPPPLPPPPVFQTVYVPGPPKRRDDYYHSLRLETMYFVTNALYNLYKR